MSLKIKKQYKNADGTITEVEGTEAEVESYEKKQQKKQDSIVQEDKKKKGMLYGKAKRVAKDAEALEELKKFIHDEIAKATAVREVHHWYYNNGYWWRPWYYGGQWTYLTTTNNPGLISNMSEVTYTTNATETAQKLNMTEEQIKAATFTISDHTAARQAPLSLTTGNYTIESVGNIKLGSVGNSVWTMSSTSPVQ